LAVVRVEISWFVIVVLLCNKSRVFLSLWGVVDEFFRCYGFFKIFFIGFIFKLFFLKVVIKSHQVTKFRILNFIDLFDNIRIYEILLSKGCFFFSQFYALSNIRNFL